MASVTGVLNPGFGKIPGIAGFVNESDWSLDLGDVKVLAPRKVYSEADLKAFISGAKKKAKGAFVSFLMKMRKQKRKERHKRKKKNKETLLGRPVREVGYIAGVNVLSPIATVKKAVYSRKYDREKKRISLQVSDFVGMQKSEKQSLTLVLAIDVSNSTMSSIKLFSDVLDSLTLSFQQSNDRIGLVAMQDMKAKLINHPTHNFRVVVGNMTKLSPSGGTPLADGVQKALEMAKTEKRRKPSSETVILLLSDCFPEPLTGDYEKVNDEPAFKAVVRAATKVGREKFQFILVRPKYTYSHGNFESFDEVKRVKTPGDLLAKNIIEVTSGRAIEIDADLRPPSGFMKWLNRSSEEKTQREIVEKIFDATSGVPVM